MEQEETLNYPYDVDPPTLETAEMRKGYIGVITRVVGSHQGMYHAGEYLESHSDRS